MENENSFSSSLNTENFIKLNDRVWQSNEFPAHLNHLEIKSMQKISKDLGIRQFRYCLHSNNAFPLQQMIIFHNYPQAINWHRQRKTGIVFYYIIKGQIDIVLCSNKIKKYKLSSFENNNFKENLSMVSLPKDIFRRIITNSSESIFLEIANGPFNDEDTIWNYNI